MPNIKEYTSPIDKLTPSDLGFTARETAGRRIGPLYQQQAADVEKGGKLLSEELGQADKLTTHELDYLGLLGQQQQRFNRGGGGGGAGRTPRAGGSQAAPAAYNPSPGIAGAAAQLTGAAAQLTGHQAGRGLYNAPEDIGASTSAGHLGDLSIVGGKVQINPDLNTWTGKPTSTSSTWDQTPQEGSVSSNPQPDQSGGGGLAWVGNVAAGIWQGINSLIDPASATPSTDAQAIAYGSSPLAASAQAAQNAAAQPPLPQD